MVLIDRKNGEASRRQLLNLLINFDDLIKIIHAGLSVLAEASSHYNLIVRYTLRPALGNTSGYSGTILFSQYVTMSFNDVFSSSNVLSFIKNPFPPKS